MSNVETPRNISKMQGICGTVIGAVNELIEAGVLLLFIIFMIF
jgi:hypothetical protein